MPLDKSHLQESLGKLSSGRLASKTNALFDEFNRSLPIDKYLAQVDIAGSRAHVQALVDVQILTEQEGHCLQSGLDYVENMITSGRAEFNDQDEDVHMWIERLLTQRIGSLGKKLHTGRSRNDQVATDTKLWLRDQSDQNGQLVLDLIEQLTALSKQHARTLMPGYTHLQQAQPITLGFHLLTYVYMLKRDYNKLCYMLRELDLSPLGSGALAGVNFDLPRLKVAHALGFKDIVPHAMDAVSDRDYVVDFLYWTTGLLGHLSRLSEDMILWSTQHFGYLSLSDEVTSGSSIMPQKKNPDACELIRGKAAIAIGRLSGMQGVLKALPLAYNKDLQEDKELMFLAQRDVSASLKVMLQMWKSAKINADNMLKGLQGGYVNATDLADYLVKKGVAFRQAHHEVGQLVQYAIACQLPLEEMSLEQLKSACPFVEPDVYEVLKYATCIEKKSSLGSTAFEQVEHQCESITSWLASGRKA